jgi:hypothetical protein
MVGSYLRSADRIRLDPGAAVAPRPSPPPPGFVLELALVQRGVAAGGGEELGVRAAFEHPALLDHQDDVRIPDGGETVGDDQSRPASQGMDHAACTAASDVESR